MTYLPRKALLSCGVAVGALAIATGAWAQSRAFDIPAQSATKAVPEFARQAGIQIISSGSDLRGLNARPVKGDLNVEIALAQLLDGTGLTFRSNGDAFVIEKVDQDPQSGSAAGGGATVEALIVTAQKREEDIQDVPIAISAFSQEDLTRSQIAGGPDLITQVPNFTFTKTNFSSYSIQIRGIGTQAISATTDPAVAVAFNNTPFIRNRFFEQEFYDLQRVEVLRGPQGTLYGRNATAGVVNIISAKPKFLYEAKASADIANYSSSRIEAMVNVPLVEDTVAMRLAGAWTKRDGYAFNELTGAPIDGRDLWSTRLSLRFAPSDRIDVNLIWEHFEENDDRLRSGKQLCKKDVVDHVGDVPVTNYFSRANAGGQQTIFAGIQATLSQGCERNSLYADSSYQRPNGLMLPYYIPLGAIGLPTALTDPYVTDIPGCALAGGCDPSLVGVTNDQPADLRVIQSTVDPEYRAKNDLGELQISFDLTDTLTLTSETAYSVDEVFSLQDFNRFNTAPGAWDVTSSSSQVLVDAKVLSPEGVFCDPQLGCSDRLVAVDLSTSKASQFSQELRLASDFEGPFNFSLGANYLRADSKDKYYVFINSLSLISAGPSGPVLDLLAPYVPGESDSLPCLPRGYGPGDPNGVYPVAGCVYMDPNPIGSLNDLGHNYFLSNNPYKLISYAVFGEAYYNLADNLKVTAGLRWTVDKKEAPRIPTWVLARKTVGYPVAEVIEQEWREPTGRLTVDWKPDLSFTDETLLYASYAHGYKAGGANPPGFVRVFYSDRSVAQGAAAASATRPKTFDPEFVDAFELGSKNTLADGRVTLNLAAFYYDYKDYQISEIVDRSAFNRNFDAEVWGAEIEADWRPLENLRLGFKGGYQKTRIADGEEAIDLMDRTDGNRVDYIRNGDGDLILDGNGDPIPFNWIVVRPFPTYASSCVLPSYVFTNPNGTIAPVGGVGGGSAGGCEIAYAYGADPVTGHPYVDLTQNPAPSGPGAGNNNVSVHPGYPGFDPTLDYGTNNGEGFAKPLGGNELPNAPNWTATITADYTIPLPNEWLVNLHTDLHWQSESYWRVFQDHEFSTLDEYFTMNLAAIFSNEAQGWNVMAYVKNVTDETAITGAFLNSDDTGLTTNVFLTEPRLYGIRVTKTWDGGPWWTGANPDHPAGEPYPFTVELSGMVQWTDAPYAKFQTAYTSEFEDTLRLLPLAQNRDLDWGDGRQVKLTWRPDGAWSVSAAVRYGRTNSDRTRLHVDEGGEIVCGILPPFDTSPCDPGSPNYAYSFIERPYTWADASARTDENHTVVDFAVGREFGLGGLSLSQVSADLRYAQFDSTTIADMRGQPYWYEPAGFALSRIPARGEIREAEFHADRRFEGVGPMLSWEAAQRLWGDDRSGHADLEWSIAAGVLFGKQDTTVTGSESEHEWTVNKYHNPHITVPDSVYTAPLDIEPRSSSVTVPVVDLSIGLSYEVQRVKLSTGYRWERYFDVLDGGFDEHKDADRTIDGPYFKLAVGFGG